MSFPRYEKYKDSGVEWLGEVPEHWVCAKLKYLTRLAYGDSLAEELRQEGSINVYGSNGSVGTHNVANTKAPCLIIGRKGSFGKINYAGHPVFAIDTTYYIDESQSIHNLRWLYYLLSSVGLETISKDTGVPGLSREDAYSYFVPIVTDKEQISIVVFLDRETAKIDDLIAEQQKLIELLKEKRQAVISHAVTKGLNPDAKMKDSGIEWLGEVPEHWFISRIKYHCTIKGRIGFRGYTTADQVDEGNGALVLGATHITQLGDIKLDESVYISWEKYYESPEIMVSPTNILVVQRGSTCGKVGFVETDIGYATINPSLVLIKDFTSLPRLIFLYLSSSLVQGLFECVLGSTAIPMLSQEQIGNIAFCMPPIKEQNEIIVFVDNQTSKLDILISEAQKAITLLQERRTALISAAVTGKIDVRGFVSDSECVVAA